MRKRDTNRKIGFATQPSSVIVTSEPEAVGAIVIVQVPPKFFSFSVTRVTRRRGGSRSRRPREAQRAARLVVPRQQQSDSDDRCDQHEQPAADEHDPFHKASDRTFSRTWSADSRLSTSY